MDVLRAAENAQTGQLALGHGVLLQHAADSQAHGQLGLLLHQTSVVGLVQSTGVTGVSTIVLLLELLAGQDGLLGVDDDDEITAVDVGRVVDLAPSGLSLISRYLAIICKALRC